MIDSLSGMCLKKTNYRHKQMSKLRFAIQMMSQPLGMRTHWMTKDLQKLRVDSRLNEGIIEDANQVCMLILTNDLLPL